MKGVLASLADAGEIEIHSIGGGFEIVEAGIGKTAEDFHNGRYGKVGNSIFDFLIQVVSVVRC